MFYGGFKKHSELHNFRLCNCLYLSNIDHAASQFEASLTGEWFAKYVWSNVMGTLDLMNTKSVVTETPILYIQFYNKANLRDLIAATSLVILLKFDRNHWFFSPCDLDIWWMTLKNNRAPLLYYIKLCASFQSRGWIQTEVTVQKRAIRVKIGNFLSRVTFKFDGRPWKTIGHLFYNASSFVHHFKAMGDSNWSYSPETLNSG